MISFSRITWCLSTRMIIVQWRLWLRWVIMLRGWRRGRVLRRRLGMYFPCFLAYARPLTLLLESESVDTCNAATADMLTTHRLL